MIRRWCSPSSEGDSGPKDGPKHQTEWSGHDFRATASTLLNEMGFRWDLIERQLAHVDASLTRRSYNHAEWLPERREMVQKWADYVDGLFSSVSNHTAPLGVTKVEIE